jgi:hypothetical protein
VTTIVLSAVFAVVVAIVLVGAILSVASSDDVPEAPSGETSYPVGRTARLAEEIERDGPVAFSTPFGPDRPILVQHLVDSPARGWLVLGAVLPGTKCTVQWDRSEKRFEDCEGRTYPPDGGDLPRYRSRVKDGRLYVERPGTASGD